MTALHRLSLLLAIGFTAGAIVSLAGYSWATSPARSIQASGRSYSVSIDEVRQNFVFGEQVSGVYVKVVRMSDGSVRKIQLRPVVKDGEELVELTDTSRDGRQLSCMGPNGTTTNGTTTNGTLMVSVRDRAQLDREWAASMDRRAQRK